MKNIENKKKTHPTKITYTLSGIIRCGKCGGAMSGKTSTHVRESENVYHYYECGTKRRTQNCDMPDKRKDVIEEKVIDALYAHLFAPDVIDTMTDKIYARAVQYSAQLPEAIEVYATQLKSLKSQQEEISATLSKGLGSESIIKKMNILETKKTRLTNQLSKARLQLATHSFSKEEIKAFLLKYQGLKSMTNMEQKRTIAIFVQSIQVFDNSLEFQILKLMENMQKRPKPLVDDHQQEVSGNTLVRVEGL